MAATGRGARPRVPNPQRPPAIPSAHSCLPRCCLQVFTPPTLQSDTPSPIFGGSTGEGAVWKRGHASQHPYGTISKSGPQPMQTAAQCAAHQLDRSAAVQQRNQAGLQPRHSSEWIWATVAGCGAAGVTPSGAALHPHPAAALLTCAAAAPASCLAGGLLSQAQVEEFHVITWESKKEQIFEMPTGGAAIMRQVRICETHAAWQLCCCSWHQPGCHIMRNCLCSSHSCCCTFAAQHMQRGATGSPLVGRHVLRQHVALQPGAAVVASSCFGGNGNAQPRCSCTVVDLAPPHLTNVLACCCLWPVCRAPTC